MASELMTDADVAVDDRISYLESMLEGADERIDALTKRVDALESERNSWLDDGK